MSIPAFHFWVLGLQGFYQHTAKGLLSAGCQLTKLECQLKSCPFVRFFSAANRRLPPPRRAACPLFLPPHQPAARLFYCRLSAVRHFPAGSGLPAFFTGNGPAYGDHCASGHGLATMPGALNGAPSQRALSRQSRVSTIGLVYIKQVPHYGMPHPIID